MWKLVLQPNFIIVYLCLFSFWWQRVTSVSRICLRGYDSCGQRRRLCLVITRNSPGMQRRTYVEGMHVCPLSAHKCLLMCLRRHETCFLACAHSCLHVHVVWDLVSPSPPMVGLSQPDGWSQPVSERWQLAGLASPGQGSGSCRLTAPDSSWWVTHLPLPTPPPMSLHHGNSWFTKKSMMSHSVL